MVAPITLTLALSHRGRGDTAVSRAPLSPAYADTTGTSAGMTGQRPSGTGMPCGLATLARIPVVVFLGFAKERGLGLF